VELSDAREKEVEALARLLCRSASLEPEAMVVRGAPFGPILVNGQQVHMVGDQAFPVWRCFVGTARAIADGGWALPDGLEPDMAPTPDAIEIEEPAPPRTPEERWRDKAGLI
jgi:hypothetical protein